MKFGKIFWALFLTVAMACYISCGSSNSSSDKGSSQQATVQDTASSGENAAFAFGVPDIEGNVHQFSDYIGKPLIINFWGTWCPPCRRELPDLKQIYAEYKPKGLEIIGLAVKDSPEQVKSFAQKEGLDWVMLMANREAANAFGLGSGVPFTVFVDKNGNIIDRAIGGRDYNFFKQRVEKII
jgi:thiol-disulfide isomerase/thioredoxin